jgi:hypothetical protein
VRNSQIIGATLIAILTFLINSHNTAVSQDNLFIWIVVVVTFTTVTYYLLHDVLEAVFAVRALEQCLLFLEDRVNTTLGANRLVWQSGVAKNLWPTAQDIGFLPPMRCIEFYGALLVLGSTVLLPSYVYYKIWSVLEDESVVRHVVVGLEIYSILSAVVALTVVRGINGRLPNKVRELVTKKWHAFGLEKELTH